MHDLLDSRQRGLGAKTEWCNAKVTVGFFAGSRLGCTSAISGIAPASART
jgi:hypothetical protein